MNKKRNHGQTWDGNTKNNRLSTVKETYQEKQYLEIPHAHMSTAGVSPGDEIGVKPINNNGQFCLLLSIDPTIGLSRTLRDSRRRNQSHSLLTIPKRVSTAARLTGNHVTYHSNSDQILAVLDHTSMITGAIEVFNVRKSVMSHWKSGTYMHQIPSEFYQTIQPDDSLWFTYDTLENGFIFVLENMSKDIPEGAIELNIQENLHQDADSNYSVHLPRQICDSLEISGQSMKWGHNGENRILGFLQ